MPKHPSKPPSPTAWIDTLDPDVIAAAYEEATVDTNGEDEQLTGLITMAQESLEFPFPAKVMNQRLPKGRGSRSECKTLSGPSKAPMKS